MSSHLLDRPLMVAMILGLSAFLANGESPFAARVVEYAPAPGQFVRNPNYNDPARALGAPSGGGLYAADNSSLVTLGGFGGYIVLAFDHTVVDHPLNPFGLDAIVFGNAIWSAGDPQSHWAECATIEISSDVNGNQIADDRWYLIPGSHIQEAEDHYASMTWDDRINNSAYPPSRADWLPTGRTGQWPTYAFMLPTEVFGSPVVVNPVAASDEEGVYGYAEYTPTLRLGDLDGDDGVDDPQLAPEDFYTWPDDPFRVGITRGAGGGDAFDIAWAIDPASGERARLTGFDFIKITNAVHAVHPLLGEKSPEIDTVADVSSDPFGDGDADGDIDLHDVAILDGCVSGFEIADDCTPYGLLGGGEMDVTVYREVVNRLTGPWAVVR